MADQEHHRPVRRRPVRWPFRLLLVLSALALIFCAVFLWAYRYRNDAFLARFIMRQNNPKMRGRLDLGAIHWGPRALIDLALGTPTPVTIRRFAVYDPLGQEVILVPWVRAKAELLPLVMGGHLVVHQMEVPWGRCLVAEMPGRKGGHAEVGLTAAFAPVKPSGRRGPRIELLDFTLRQVELKLRFSGWSLDLDRVASTGSFIITGGPAAVEGIRYSLTPRAPRGKLVIRGFEVPLRDLRAERFEVSAANPMDLHSTFSVEAGGSRTRLTGKLTGIYRGPAGVDVSLVSHEAQRLIAPLLGRAGAGPGRLVATIRGPLAAPLIEGKIFEVGLGTGALRAAGMSGLVTLDTARGKLRARELQGRFLSGRFLGYAGMDLRTGDWSGKATVTALDPGALSPHLEGLLSGELRLRGGIYPVLRGELGMGLTLRRRRRDVLPRELRIGGTLHAGPSVFDLAGVTIAGEGNTLRASGSMNLRTREVRMNVGLEVSRLDGWLARLNLPALARTGRAALLVRGRFPELRAAGSLELREVGYRDLRLPRLFAAVDFGQGSLRLHQIRGDGLGGRLGGEGAIRLFEGSDVTRPLSTPTLGLRLKGEGFDLAALGAKDAARGRLSGEVELVGPLFRPEGKALLRLVQAEILGERYRVASARLELQHGGLRLQDVRLARTAGGGLEGEGTLFFDRRVDLRLMARSFPLSGVFPLLRGPRGIDGLLGGKVAITGSLDDPRLSGVVQVTAARIRGVSVGSGSLTFVPGSDGVRIKGHLLDRLVRLEGFFIPAPVMRVHLTVDVTRFPLQKLLFELQQIGDVRGVVSGRLGLTADAEAGLTWAHVRLDALKLSLHYRPPDERRIRVIELSTGEDLVASFDGKELRWPPVRLFGRVVGQRGEQAEFTLGGQLSPAQIDLRLRGSVMVEILEFFFPKQLRKLSGDVLADIRLAGPLTAPQLLGHLDLNYISILPAKFDRPLEIAQGRVRLLPGKVRLERLKVQLDADRLSATGEVRLERLRPTTVELAIQGNLNVRLLQFLFPQGVSHAAGRAQVKLRLNGPVRDPQFSGTLAVQRIELAPRGWGRTITLKRGEVAFSNYLVEVVRDLEGTYDEGLIRLSGEVRIDNWDLADIYLKIVGTGIPQREPRVYTAEANLNLLLLGDSRQLVLEGNVDLVDARYIRSFDIIRQAFIKPQIHEEETPFWKGSHLLERLRLQLQIQSIGQLTVKNNYAQLSLSGAMTVTGVLSDPRLSGQARVEEGTFKIPFLRGEFTINRGEITFDEKKTVDQAEISISGETSFLDRSGVDYLVKLSLLGPLSHIGIQLTSNPTLEQGQIISLLAFGKTTDQLRTELTASGSGQQRGGQAFGAADAQVKQLTGDIMAQIVEDPVKKVTQLDIFRFEPGTQSTQLLGCKKLGRQIDLCGEYERFYLGETRAEGRFEYKISDLLKLIGKVEHLPTRLEVESIEPNRGRAELKIRLPLR